VFAGGLDVQELSDVSTALLDFMYDGRRQGSTRLLVPRVYGIWTTA
jgi:hypothetical protein